MTRKRLKKELKCQKREASISCTVNRKKQFQEIQYSCLHMCGFCKCRFIHEILLQTQAILKLAASQHRQEHRLHQAPVYPSHMALQTSHGTAFKTPLMQSKDSNFSLVRWLPSSNRPNTLIRPRDQFYLYATCKQHRLKLCSSSQTQLFEDNFLFPNDPKWII